MSNCIITTNTDSYARPRTPLPSHPPARPSPVVSLPSHPATSSSLFGVESIGPSAGASLPQHPGGHQSFIGFSEGDFRQSLSAHAGSTDSSGPSPVPELSLQVVSPGRSEHQSSGSTGGCKPFSEAILFEETPSIKKEDEKSPVNCEDAGLAKEDSESGPLVLCWFHVLLVADKDKSIILEIATWAQSSSMDF